MARKRILIVDDDGETSYVCSRYLSKEYDVTNAGNGDQALAAWGSESFDLMLLDLKMPGLDWRDVLKWVKDRHPECAVITMTGVSALETVNEVLAHGADGHLSKPFEMAVLGLAVKKGLAKPGAHADIVQGKRILVADDDQESLEYFHAVLAAKGAIVIGVDNGRKALDKASQHEPHLIFVDAMLPDMEGFDVCFRLKKSLATRPPIVIMTARLDPQDKDRAAQAGADQFHIKPIDPYVLVETAERLLTG